MGTNNSRCLLEIVILNTRSDIIVMCRFYYLYILFFFLRFFFEIRFGEKKHILCLIRGIVYIISLKMNEFIE
jgi:hypothetical protein